MGIRLKRLEINTIFEVDWRLVLVTTFLLELLWILWELLWVVQLKLLLARLEWRLKLLLIGLKLITLHLLNFQVIGLTVNEVIERLGKLSLIHGWIVGGVLFDIHFRLLFLMKKRSWSLADIWTSSSLKVELLFFVSSFWNYFPHIRKSWLLNRFGWYLVRDLLLFLLHIQLLTLLELIFATSKRLLSFGSRFFLFDGWLIACVFLHLFPFIFNAKIHTSFLPFGFDIFCIILMLYADLDGILVLTWKHHLASSNFLLG